MRLLEIYNLGNFKRYYPPQSLIAMNKRLSVASTLIIALISTSALASESPNNIIANGKFSGELRYRYESVDQNGPASLTKEAKASTLRTTLGFLTGEYHNFQAYLEGQASEHIGNDNFNDTINGKANSPIVADPESEEINQAWLSWKTDDIGLNGLQFKLGRQIINLDNQRFIGSVDWRQNDQTFDAASFIYGGVKNLGVTYAYINNVNRVFGDNHPLGDLDSNSHIMNISYVLADPLKLTGYGYFLDFDNLSSRSSLTYGLRATGKAPLNSAWTFQYEAEYARQSDYANSTADYNESYYHVAPALSAYGLTTTVGYEVLGGNGTNAFQTPLATLHKFNGWADRFLDTPNAGLRDAYGSVSYKFHNSLSFLSDVTLNGAYHVYKGDKSGNFGDETNVSISRSFELPKGPPFKKFNLLAKYADYNADDLPFRDTQKFWIQAGISF